MLCASDRLAGRVLITSPISKSNGGQTYEYLCAVDKTRTVEKKDKEVAQLTESLLSVTAERDAAVDKLSGIQQLMAG